MKWNRTGPLVSTAALCALLPAWPARPVDFFWSATDDTFDWFAKETPNGPPGFSPWRLFGGGITGEEPDAADDNAFLTTAGKTTTLGTSVTVGTTSVSGGGAILQMNGGVLTNVNGMTIPTANAELAFTGGTVTNSTGGLTNLGIIRGLSGSGFLNGDVTTSGQVIIGNGSTVTFGGNNTDFDMTAGGFDVIAGGTANFNGTGRAFNLTGGTLNNDGSLNINSGPTFTLDGGAIINTGDLRINSGGTFNHVSGSIAGEVRLVNGGDLNLMVPLTTPAPSLGTPTFRFTGNGSVTGDIHEAVTVVIENTTGSVTVGAGATPIENRGTVELNSDTFGGFSALSFQSGGELDNNGGTVHAAFTPGASTDRRLLGSGAATLTNRNGGELNVDGDVQLTLTMDVVNTADINVGMGGAILAGNNVLFEMNGGTLSNDGTVEFSSGSGPSAFRYTGGTITGNAIEFNNGQLELNGGTGAALFRFTGTGLNRHSGDILADQTVVIDAATAAASVSNGTGFNENNSFASAGTIRLTGADSNDTAQYFLAGQTSVFTNTGLIHAQGVALSSNSRIFSGSSGAAIINSGQITVDPDTTLSLNLAVTNTGDVTIGSGGTLDMDAPNANAGFTHNAGAIVNNGRFVLGSGDDFTYSGGTITGNAIEVSEAVLTLGAGTGPASFILERGQLAGDINAGQTVELRNDLTSNQIIDTPGAMANNGVLIHGGDGAGNGSNIFRIGGLFQNLTLTNNGDYIARNDNPSQLGGGRTINGVLDNHANAAVEPFATYRALGTINRGSFTIQPDGTVNLTGGQTFTQQDGTLTNNGTFNLGGGTFNYNGGDVTGNTIIADGTLIFAPGLTGGGDFVMNTNGAFGGEVPAQASVRFVGPATNSFVVNAGAAPGNITNYGLIVLDNSLGGFVDLRTLGTHTIGETGRLEGGGRVSFQAGPATLSNQGTIAPGGVAGDETGLLRVSGMFTQEATGTLEIQLGGTDNADFDRITATSALDLDGTLDLSLVPGYTPMLGDSFTVLSGTSRTGMFISPDVQTLVPGLAGEVSYTANSVVVNIIAAALLGDLDGDSDVDDADYGLMFAAFTGPGAGPSSNPAADFDNDGDVDDADFALAFAAFTGPGNPANVPEPASLLILTLAGLASGRRRRAS